MMHAQAFKTVYRNPVYVVISLSIFVLMSIIILNAGQILFFEPYFVLNLTQDTILSFLLTLIVSALTGLVVSIAIFQFWSLKAQKNKIGAGLGGSALGAVGGICTSCSSTGFLVMSNFGIVGATTISFLQQYEIPIRIVSIGILLVTYFSLVRGIASKCRLDAST